MKTSIALLFFSPMIFFFPGMLLLGACGHHAQPAASSKDSLPGSDTSATTNQFFPVDDYLEAEILSVDSLPMAFWKYVTHDNRTDSALINTAQFNALALQFLPPEIRDGGLNKNFTESSFMDRATQTITFTYTPVNKDLPLQRVDVQTEPGVRAQHVKSIYLERSRVAGDSVILQKLLWSARHSFQIVTLIRIKDKALQEEQVRVVWADEDVEQ
ncbi:MAG TPA: hypothetical protein VG605_11205 [Puia sp.]|nr:hypothetical protein [Puia sp.]